MFKALDVYICKIGIHSSFELFVYILSLVSNFHRVLHLAHQNHNVLFPGYCCSENAADSVLLPDNAENLCWETFSTFWFIISAFAVLKKPIYPPACHYALESLEKWNTFSFHSKSFMRRVPNSQPHLLELSRQHKNIGWIRLLAISQYKDQQPYLCWWDQLNINQDNSKCY